MHKPRGPYLWAILLFFFLALSLPSPSLSKRRPLVIFHAGSLTVPFSIMEREFEAEHPEIDILREGGGSTKMARLITQVGKPADIFASADYRVIDEFLIPDFASWNILFATNQLVLCYTEKSLFADKINKENWPDILLEKGVRWGSADPNLDPCGYRALMVMKLAERYYKRPGLYERLIGKRPLKNIRPKSIELISLLKAGSLDYAWEYLSVAVQHGLKFIRLPMEINLGSPKYEDIYKTVTVKVLGKRPGQWIKKKGSACIYGITVLKNARNKEDALTFLKFLLDEKRGLRILSECGQPPLVPPRLSKKVPPKDLPKGLKILFSKGAQN